MILRHNSLLIVCTGQKSLTEGLKQTDVTFVLKCVLILYAFLVSLLISLVYAPKQRILLQARKERNMLNTCCPSVCPSVCVLATSWLLCNS